MMKTSNQTARTKPANEKSDFTGDDAIFAAVETELEALREELASERDARLRLAAEYDNYRRRTKREAAQAAEAGKRELLNRLISIADDLDLALANLSVSSEGPVAEGLRMIDRRFRETLEASGVVGFENRGEKFDPERHEAFDLISDADSEPETVQREIRRGYFWRGKLLRPALVVVAR
jgi:molecular chaperone GrpE